MSTYWPVKKTVNNSNDNNNKRHRHRHHRSVITTRTSRIRITHYISRQRI